jgi:asparagine synthase (glutamine-hydrolysing)
MCGINGMIRFDGAPVREDVIVEMRDAMAHRGPDGTGVWVSNDRRIALGHRRLAIIDLSDAAIQPMSIDDGALQLVFNGEIYNHADIRAELTALGHREWKTDHSDTEVILRAFKQWGIDCIHRFRGMFAIALWDAKARELWLVRDRIGIKPLYYSHDGKRLAFASEIKALLRDPEQPRQVDREGLFHFLSFLTTPAPITLFKGIRKLPNGTWMRVKADGSVEEKRYWDVWDYTSPLTDISDDELSERIRSTLRTAVKLRKVSDRPVGVFLSGGIDSSANVALFSEDGGAVRTFTIGYQGDHASYRNETDYARRMADIVHAEHHELLLSQDDVINFLPRMVWLQDEPIADPVCAPLYYVSKLAREHGVIVAQAGEGSDELFCGYPAWKTRIRIQDADDLPVPASLKRAGLWALAKSGRKHTWPYELLRRGSVNQPTFWGGAEAFTESQKRLVMSASMQREFHGATSWSSIESIHKRFTEKAWDQSPLHWMSYLDLNLRLPELLLMRLDKMSMGVSLEGRVPFLDHEFVQLAMSIPAERKLRGGELKHVLKKAVRGIIPDEMIDRKKQGFGVPLQEWFFDRLGAFAEAELRRFCAETDFLDFHGIEQLIARRAYNQLWFLLNFALWWKEFIAAQPQPAPPPLAAAAVR